jgi:hypothetical protein
MTAAARPNHRGQLGTYTGSHGAADGNRCIVTLDNVALNNTSGFIYPTEDQVIKYVPAVVVAPAPVVRRAPPAPLVVAPPPVAVAAPKINPPPAAIPKVDPPVAKIQPPPAVHRPAGQRFDIAAGFVPIAANSRLFDMRVEYPTPRGQKLIGVLTAVCPFPNLRYQLNTIDPLTNLVQNEAVVCGHADLRILGVPKNIHDAVVLKPKKVYVMRDYYRPLPEVKIGSTKQFEETYINESRGNAHLERAMRMDVSDGSRTENLAKYRMTNRINNHGQAGSEWFVGTVETAVATLIEATRLIDAVLELKTGVRPADSRPVYLVPVAALPRITVADDRFMFDMAGQPQYGFAAGQRPADAAGQQ